MKNLKEKIKNFLIVLFLSLNKEVKNLNKQITMLRKLSSDLDKKNRLLKYNNEILKSEIEKKDLELLGRGR
jgi:hypothetical protein